jgi:hypothetical protein
LAALHFHSLGTLGLGFDRVMATSRFKERKRWVFVAIEMGVCRNRNGPYDGSELAWSLWSLK